MSRINLSVARLLVGAVISVALGWGAGMARAEIISMSSSNDSQLTDVSQLVFETGLENTTTVATVGELSTVPTWGQVLPAVQRFVPVMGSAAILDKETGLVWEQSPQMTTYQWSDARLECMSRTVAGRMGWRLPSVNELTSLLDISNINPALPTDHPFSNVWASRYWSATTSAAFPSLAWNGHFGNGEVASYLKSSFLFVWCVRGGGALSEY